MNLSLSFVLQLLFFLPIFGVVSLLLSEGRFCNLNPSRIYNLTTWGTVLASFFISSVLMWEGVAYVEVDWFPSFGLNLSFLVDGLTYLLILFTAFIFLLYGLLNREQSGGFYAMLLLIQISLTGVFLSYNLLMFYFFYELMLFPVFYLMSAHGGSIAKKAAYQFLIYTLIGSLFLLLAIIYAGFLYYQSTGNFSFDVFDLVTYNFTKSQQMVLFGGFFLAFAVKSPIFPFHSWLPITYSNAPKGLAIILGGLLFQAGVYGLFRFNLVLFPDAFAEYSYPLAILATIGIVYGAMLAYRSKSVRGMMSYASISHVGFSILGLSVLTSDGITGGLFQIFSHILIAVGLFTIAFIMQKRSSTEELQISDFSGLASKAPIFSFCVIGFSLAAISLPLTMSFVGEFQVLATAFSKFPIVTMFALLGVILGAVYMLNFCQQILFGEPMSQDFADLDQDEQTVLISLLSIILILGIFPSLVGNLISNVTNQQLHQSKFQAITVEETQPKRLPKELVLTSLPIKNHE